MRGFERRLLARENAVTLWRLAGAAPRSWGIVSAVRPQVAVGSEDAGNIVNRVTPACLRGH